MVNVRGHPGGFDLGSERSHNLTFASCVHEPHVDQIPGASVRRFDSYLIRGWFAPGSGIRPCADRGHYSVAGVEGVPADISVFICRCHHGMRGCTGYGFVREIGGVKLKLVVRGSGTGSQVIAMSLRAGVLTTVSSRTFSTREAGSSAWTPVASSTLVQRRVNVSEALHSPSRHPCRPRAHASSVSWPRS